MHYALECVYVVGSFAQAHLTRLTSATGTGIGSQFVLMSSTSNDPSLLNHNPLDPSTRLQLSIVQLSDVELECAWYNPFVGQLFFTDDEVMVLSSIRFGEESAEIFAGHSNQDRVVDAPKGVDARFENLTSVIGTSDRYPTLYVGDSWNGTRIRSIDTTTSQVQTVVTLPPEIDGAYCLRFDRTDRFSFESMLYFLTAAGEICFVNLAKDGTCRARSLSSGCVMSLMISASAADWLFPE